VKFLAANFHVRSIQVLKEPAKPACPEVNGRSSQM